MLRTLASYFLGENEAANSAGTGSSEPSVEVIVARELNDEPESEGDDDWVLVDDSDDGEGDDVEEDSLSEAPAATRMSASGRENVAPALVRARVCFVEEQPEIRACGRVDNNNVASTSTSSASLNGSIAAERDGISESVEVDETEEPEENGLMDGDFAWENSLIEHPSVYIASQQQRRIELEEEKRMMLMKKPKRKSGRRRLGRVARQQQKSLAGAMIVAADAGDSSAGGLTSSVVAGQADLPVDMSTSRTSGRAPAHHSHGSSNGLMEFLDVLKLQQQQQLVEQQRRGSGKRKHCIRDSRVHQNICNKPQRRSDKQNYNRTSRMNNDRKCNRLC